jgi:hypothetical protein
MGSTLMTSAPKSAKTMPHVGPMTMWVNSTTRKPAKGSGRLGEASSVIGKEAVVFISGS